MKREVNSLVLDFCPVRRRLGWPSTLSGPQIKAPAVHRAFDATCTIYVAANQRALTVRAAVIDGKDCSVDIEESDLYAADCYELPFPWGKFVGLAGCLPTAFCRSVRQRHKSDATDA